MGICPRRRGPFAEKFHELIPDYDGRERLNVDAMKLRFERMRDGVKNQYGFNEKQMAEANQLVEAAMADVKDYLDSNKLEVDKYFQDLKQNTERRHSKDFQETPFAQKWVWDKQQELQTTVKPWTAWVDDRANELLASLNQLGDGIEPARPPYHEPPTELEKADKLVLYSNLAIGVCLIIGLVHTVRELLGCALHAVAHPRAAAVGQPVSAGASLGRGAVDRQ